MTSFKAAVWQLPVEVELVLTTGRKAGLLQLSLIFCSIHEANLWGV